MKILLYLECFTAVLTHGANDSQCVSERLYHGVSPEVEWWRSPKLIGKKEN